MPSISWMLARQTSEPIVSPSGIVVASIERDPCSRRYRIRFRYARREYKRSLKTADNREARAILGRVEETILLLERGRIIMPPDADPAIFILTDGRLNTPAAQQVVLTLGELFENYREQLPEGTKEPTTIRAEKIHCDHLLRHLKARTVVRSLKAADLQRYVTCRLRDTWRDKPVRTETIQKELATLRMIWNWGITQGLLESRIPLSGIRFPKRDEKPPFMTLAEAQRIVRRGGLSTEQEREIWDAVYLTREDVHELLEHVRKTARHPFIYPMFVFAAHTGARRSEIFNSRIDDFDFAAGTVLLREKKRSRKLGTTFRRVDLTPLLQQVMQDWFAIHPGGPYTIYDEGRLAQANRFEKIPPFNPVSSQKHFRQALKNTPWAKLRGFHVFRHSFASNLASLVPRTVNPVP